MSTYDKMNNDQLKAAVRAIVRSSSSEDEVKQRVATELGYRYSLAITSHLPQDEVGRQARGFVHALGGLTMKNGAMVMIMMYGRKGEILSL